MYYKISEKSVEVHITNLDIDKGIDIYNPYEHFPSKVKDFIHINKDKQNFKESKVNGRTQYEDDSSIDGMIFLFELT